MSSFTQRLAVAQAGIDNLTGKVNMDFHQSHPAQSMIKEGYFRPEGAQDPLPVAAITHNGKKWSDKMVAAGYLSGTVVGP